MNENYASAASRHFEDAELLASHERFDNAGQLVGLAAECALKHAWQQWQPATLCREHFPSLRDKALKSLSCQRSRPMLTVLKMPNLLLDWEIELRYNKTGICTREQWEGWKKDAQRLMNAAQLKLPRGGYK